MNASVNEREMHLSKKYCLDLIKSLSELLVSTTRTFDGAITNSNNKIKQEEEDINDLKIKFDLSNKLLHDNLNRIEQIPSLILNLNIKIEENKEEIDSIPVPAYCEKYDRWNKEWYETIDRYQTSLNEARIENLEYENFNMEYEIKELEKELIKCKENVMSLENMINDISICIQMKKDLICKIKENISSLTNNYNSFKKDLLNTNTELDLLKDKIQKAIEFIHNYGTTMAKISYKNMMLRYNDNDIFSINSEGINQIIDMLQMSINANLVSISTCSKALFNFSNQLKDNLSEQVKVITVERALELKKITESYQNMITILKKALSYLVSYENIKI